jgi:Leucine-rich repeat (LRR) protein
MEPLRKKVRLHPEIPQDHIFLLEKETELEEIYADDLRLVSDFSVLKNLTTPIYITLCNNVLLRDLEFLGQKPNLKKLYLNNTGLLNLIGIEECTALEELSLQHCLRLKDLSGISHVTSLKKIDLSYCPGIYELDKLFTLPNLVEINLRGCYQISDNPEIYRSFPGYREKLRFN